MNEEVSDIDQEIDDLIVDQEPLTLENTSTVQDEVNTWYSMAKETRDHKGLQKVIETVLSEFRGGGATTPHAYASIALAGLKMASVSKLGKLNHEQAAEFLSFLAMAITPTD